MRPLIVPALLLLTACGAAGPDGTEVASRTENGTAVRVVRLEPGLYRVTTRSRGDTRNPDEIALYAATSAADAAVDPFCTNAFDRLPDHVWVPGERVGANQRDYSGRFLIRCRPDPRSAEELEALRRAPRTRPHPCGLLFDERGGITGSAPC